MDLVKLGFFFSYGEMDSDVSCKSDVNFLLEHLNMETSKSINDGLIVVSFIET